MVGMAVCNNHKRELLHAFKEYIVLGIGIIFIGGVDGIDGPFGKAGSEEIRRGVRETNHSVFGVGCTVDIAQESTPAIEAGIKGVFFVRFVLFKALLF